MARNTEAEFPWLGEEVEFSFPPACQAPGDEPLAMGGRLSPGLLLSAYSQGIFPWYSRGPIQWWSPDPRFVLFFERLHFPKRLWRLWHSGVYVCRMDTAFDQVIQHCATVRRRDQRGTWIVREMQDAYRELHQLGYAHSVETWKDGRLCGGLYGVSLGRIFCGESMFSLEDNCSKLAFLNLVLFLAAQGLTFVDSQVHTPLFAGFGGIEIPRLDYLNLTGPLVAPRKDRLWGSWKDRGSEALEPKAFLAAFGTGTQAAGTPG